MAHFYGLFIGTDKYNSPRISELRCAAKDALALHALFADTIDGKIVHLINQEATRFNIEKQFEQLKQCKEEDVVVIYFSGHGSETHELVTHDTDPDRLQETAIPLELLTEWFSTIPAKQLICILDCCFSGGMGAKVLKVDLIPRDIASTEKVLDKIAGEGRLILTASSARQEAWENLRFGHGLLTYYLIEALQGVEEVRQDSRISFYRLLDYVSQRVTESARQLGREQHPNIRGKIDEAFMWPVFKPGAFYQKVYPEVRQVPVTSDIQSLSNYGFSPELIFAWAQAIPSLNQLQIDAINEFKILDGQHLVVSAPTSSGKTMIGELAVLKGILEQKRAVFLLPLKAVVNDKHKQFNKTYGALGVRIIKATGDSTDDMPDLMYGRYDICLMTYEKFTALALLFPHILEQCGTVVVDEVQMIADKTRGANLEFILTLVRMRRRRGIIPQLIVLSAVIGDTNGLERWLDARLLRRTERPVPLDEGIIRGDGSFRFIDSETESEKITTSFVQQVYRKGSNQDWVIPLVRKLVTQGKQVIVFREKKGQARATANYLAETLNLQPAQSVVESLPKGDPSIASTFLRNSLLGGVAFHTSELDRDERLLIEEEFREPNSEIRVIAATTTLAMGVNTPAEAVIIVGLEHPARPPERYSVAEYKNMVGRAGRLGLVSRGEGYLLALTPMEEHDFWARYVLGTPENLISRFLDNKTDVRSLIVKVLTTARKSAGKGLVGMTAEEIINFLEDSFGAFQKTQDSQAWKWNQTQLISAVEDLKRHNLIKQIEEGKYRLTKLGWLAGQGGIEVESVIRLVDVIGTLDPNEINDPTLIALTQLTVELDDLFFPVNSRGARKESQTWSNELEHQNVPLKVLSVLLNTAENEYKAASRVKKAAASLLWITDKTMNEIEDIMTKHGGKWDGVAGPIRNVSSRTHDLLHTVVRVTETLHPDVNLEDRGSRLFTRLEVGVPAPVIDIARCLGNRLSRPDYQLLMRNNIVTLDAIKNASDEYLLPLFNNDNAKVQLVRNTIEIFSRQFREKDFEAPLLPPYEE